MQSNQFNSYLDALVQVKKEDGLSRKTKNSRRAQERMN